MLRVIVPTGGTVGTIVDDLYSQISVWLRAPDAHMQRAHRRRIDRAGQGDRDAVRTGHLFEVSPLSVTITVSVMALADTAQVGVTTSV